MIRSTLLFVAIAASYVAMAQETNTRPLKILIHVTCGPENPSKAALAFLIARTAAEEGHNVSMFLAADAVQLLRNDVLDNLSGLGTGKLREHFDVILKSGGKFYLSGMSGKSRGVTDADLQSKNAQFALPKVLLQLAIESDKMFVY